MIKRFKVGLTAVLLHHQLDDAGEITVVARESAMPAESTVHLKSAAGPGLST